MKQKQINLGQIGSLIDSAIAIKLWNFHGVCACVCLLNLNFEHKYYTQIPIKTENRAQEKESE